MPAVSDPYRALGVPRGASKAEIKAAHRTLAKRYHPDGAAGDARRFLLVQEAYRVLSDPLLRREWDARHAPGPVRATGPAARAATSAPAATASKPTSGRATRAAPRPRRAPPTADTAAGQPQPAQARPRSARSYTWSAAEVPWWEEGIKRDPKRATQRKPAPRAAQTEPEAERPVAAPDFEVYNRSSGAAWSMAARAYFRKGDQDLPSRGVFRQQGGQPVTAGRARAAAEAEARTRAARNTPTPPPDTTDGAGDGRPGGDGRPNGGDR
jgi:hypothetical protein